MPFSPVNASFEGFQVIKRAPVAVLLWCVIYLVLMAAIVALIAAPMIQFATSINQMAAYGGEPDPGQVFGLLAGYFGAMLLTVPVSLVGNAVFYAAVSRAVLRPEESAFGYIRFGGDELRLIVTNLVQGLVFGLIGVAVGILFGVIFGIVAASSSSSNSDPTAAVFAILGLQAVVWLVVTPLIIWIGIKLSLTTPIVIAEQRIAIFDSWGRTKGRFWGLLGMGLLAYVLATVISTLSAIIIVPVFFLAGAGAFPILEQMDTANTVDWQALMSAIGPAVVICGVLLVVVSVLQAIVMIAPFSRAYLEIVEEASGRAPPLDHEAPLL